MRWALLLAVLLPLLAGCDRDRSAPALYRKNCARCHGDRGQGPKKPVKLYPRLSLLVSPMVLHGDRAAVRQRLLEGHGPMPSFRRRLTPEELERLIDFTLQLPSRKEGP
ncbi:MAG TPA: cytochrome c [Thermoanaerobaculia bacterium]|nr:cytochrome c [Thermoanaerobaculia bacterium]